ncbi:MAG: glycoside hydrolase family 65 protein [Bacteroidetes bacterium]|nr:MAG: glycoside hydrolase family 65 protein [Bacteroidota bacterium]TAG89457.1 MAG: glycoside hydrolase family 65 protein [Bacteroidota bacterium]
MKDYIKADEWKIIEEGFKPELNKISESLCSIGNGHQGQRANFEETYSGETLQGSYMAGVYYPDKTRVGWWKNGYPEYFAKVLNATNWIGIKIWIDGEELDLATSKVSQFSRILNMQEGFLERSFVAKLNSGKEIKVKSQRFVSAKRKEIGAIKYQITPLNFSGKLETELFLDGDIKNEDANYDEKFWEEVDKQATNEVLCLTLKTKKTGFYLTTATTFEVFQEDAALSLETHIISKEKYLSLKTQTELKQNEKTTIYKFASQVTSRDVENADLVSVAKSSLQTAFAEGFESLKKEQAETWAEKWKHADIVIEGDIKAQQGIRFNIFQLDQTYTGTDERLNIGPKGFTGEKYGGSTYWDTEAYCLAFYLATAEPKVAKNLLVYRYKHLQKAIENAQKLGFTNGAALFPMVTMNGEECHNEWEITFEEIHRNGAIARAVFDYVNYTQDKEYLADFGLELLIAIARFWAQRVHFSQPKQKYVMHGVTGPNEYENNINNNWYTNVLAAWCLDYTKETIDFVEKNYPQKYENLALKIDFKAEEIKKWLDISQNMYYPADEKLGIFLQQEGYLDKEQILVADLPQSERPINQKWSWDRILRSCFIKQADTLQGIYLFEDRYDIETIRKNFEFYEPRTVHESSLSPCVHSILASKLGMKEKAYQMYLRTSRLDLDDYNNDTEDGLHITSMAGTWMSVVQGFGGMRVRNGELYFTPYLPQQWKGFSFRIGFKNAWIQIKVSTELISLKNETTQEISLFIYQKNYTLKANQELKIDVKKIEDNIFA